MASTPRRLPSAPPAPPHHPPTKSTAVASRPASSSTKTPRRTAAGASPSAWRIGETASYHVAPHTPRSYVAVKPQSVPFRAPDVSSAAAAVASSSSDAQQLRSCTSPASASRGETSAGHQRVEWSASAVSAELPVYNALLDHNLATYYSAAQRKKRLIDGGLVTDDGRIVRYDRQFGRVVVAQQVFRSVEEEEERRQRDARLLDAQLRRLNEIEHTARQKQALVAKARQDAADRRAKLVARTRALMDRVHTTSPPGNSGGGDAATGRAKEDRDKTATNANDSSMLTNSPPNGHHPSRGGETADSSPTRSSSTTSSSDGYSSHYSTPPVSP